MHLLIVPKEIEEAIPIYNGLNLEPGGKYICTNAFTGQMLLSRWKVKLNGEKWSLRFLLSAMPFASIPFDANQDWNNRDVWLYRGGGFGDLLMLTPLIREMKRLWPRSRVHIACGGDYHALFQGIDVIPELLPVPYEKMNNGIDAIIDFEELVEGNPDAEKLHMAQLFADRAGIELTNMKPDYFVTEEERSWAKQWYPPTPDRPRIGIQFIASAMYRTHPSIGKVMVDLAKRAQIFLFGLPGQIQLKEPVAHVRNLMDEKLTFRQSAAILETCKSCISPDSAMVHMASALDVPCVALYGPFPSHLRTTSEKTFAFNGKAPCAPCFFHAEHMGQFPPGMPCEKTQRCVALESISVDRIVQKAWSLATNGRPGLIVPAR